MLTVIIVNYNTRHLTLECLRSIDGQASRIVVVDNASTDGSPDALRAWASGVPHRQVILNEENRGFAAANNLALADVETDYVLLLNSDTLVPSGALRELVTWMETHPEVGCCGPRLAYPDGTPQPSPSPLPSAWMYLIRFSGLKHLLPTGRLRNWLAAAFRPLLGVTVRSHLNPDDMDWQRRDVEYLSGAALLLRKKVIDQVGPLDERFFMHLEDADWCIRIRRAGWKLGFVRNVTVVHYAGASFQESQRPFRAVHPESFKSVNLYMCKYFNPVSRALVNAAMLTSLGSRTAFGLLLLPIMKGQRRQRLLQDCVFNFRNFKVVLGNLQWNAISRKQMS